MTRPALPLPAADDGPRVPGMLLIRTDDGDDAWRDVLSRLGELPGQVAPRPGHEARSVPPGPIPRRLVVVDDLAWRGATLEEVREALGADGTWLPDLVLLSTDRTAADPRLRPLLAFRGADGDAFRITPRQAALTYLVLHRPFQDMTLDSYEEKAPAELDYELEEDETLEDWEDALPDPVGTYVESLSPPPRYEPPARTLPLLTQETFGLLVRTDFTDDAAWASLLDAVHRPGRGYDDPVDDYSDSVDAVDDPAFDGSSPEQVMAMVCESESSPDQMTANVVMIADGSAVRDPECGLLVVPLNGPIGFTFRIDPESAGSMAANLAIANMDIEDFMDGDTKAEVLDMQWLRDAMS
ncbi:hypothetical protein SZN_30904 [Streptomyces zinciresistens K42]|uniref:DUF6924 domain-containing protein n=1 Tax=Streptomyces zinciresistens K42 TaxID=700597 RepID=G2GKY7_9ACTN|nr:hypothetical protein [Streptomyces zinciresistens]EGX55837.1 hypothetical protein SZN_30904 [Streptomyces zinciresistens K42]